jgi:FKBP-type peptidyl-prolyl cis-trans isomerase
MLQNTTNLLPVAVSSVASLIVVGSLADQPNLGDGGSSDVKSTSVVTPLEGLRVAFPDAEVVHLSAPELDQDRISNADLVVVVVGYTKADEGEYIDAAGTAVLAGSFFPPMDHPELGVSASGPEESDSTAPASVDGAMSPGGDRDSLRLSESDESMIATVGSLNSATVVSVQCGSAVMMPWADEVASVLVSWYSGVEGGHALADIVTGVAEPGGRLPFAIPADAAHLVDFDKDATQVTYGLLHGQWHVDANGVRAAHPFGAGQGFTSWALVDAALCDDGESVSVRVANTGDRSGSTVVFVHASVDDSTWSVHRSGWSGSHASTQMPATRLLPWSGSTGANSTFAETADGGWSRRTTDSTSDSTPQSRQPCSASPADSFGAMQKPEVTIPAENPPTELVVEDITVGDGDEATAGQQVNVHYVGVSWSTGEQFDASWDRMEPFGFGLGQGQVISGWDEGVQGMKVGGRRRLTIPPSLGYGAAGAGGVIAPNETLVFVVDLLGVR